MPKRKINEKPEESEARVKPGVNVRISEVIIKAVQILEEISISISKQTYLYFNI